MRARTVIPALVALCACAPAPQYQPPPQPVPATWRDTTAVQVASVADAPWWRIYRDTTLARLVRTALAHNTDLGIALEGVSAARAMLAAARGAQLPTLVAFAAVDRGSAHISEAATGTSAATSYTSTSKGYTAELNARWELDIFGLLRNDARSAAATLQATEERRRGVALLVVAGVASAYVDLQAADQDLEVANRALAARRGYLDPTKRRLDSSASAELDYRQAQGLYEAARETAIDLQEEAADAENALSVLLGRAPGPIPRTGAPGDQLLAAVPAGLPSALVARRPDVRAAERDLAAAGADVGAARAQLLPQVDVGAGLWWTKTPGDSTVIQGFSMVTPTSTVTRWDVSLSVSQPLFMGGRLVADLHGAESRRRAALLAYQGVVLGALQDVETQLAAMRFAGERRPLADSQVVYAAAALEAAEARYAAGASPFLEVVDAQRTLLAAELGAVAARVRQADAVIGLYEALGGGWQDDSTDATGGPTH